MEHTHVYWQTCVENGVADSLSMDGAQRVRSSGHGELAGGKSREGLVTVRGCRVEAESDVRVLQPQEI